MRLALLFMLLSAGPTLAEVLVPLRTIRAQSIVTAADFRVEPVEVKDAFPVTTEVDGLEARVALYAGRPVRAGDLGPPALVRRNDIVTLVYTRNGLQIATGGRALGRGGLGDTVRVMNLSSRTTVSGRVLENGTVEVR